MTRYLHVCSYIVQCIFSENLPWDCTYHFQVYVTNLPYMCCQTNNPPCNGWQCFQVYVTGADGEQMVLSGPEAAALLAQAGISLGEQEQVGFVRI